MLEDVLSEEKSDLSEVAHVQNVTGPLKIPIRKPQIADPLKALIRKPTNTDRPKKKPPTSCVNISFGHLLLERLYC